MATWDPPTDVQLGKDKAGKPSLARRIRDLPIALAERASGSPWLNSFGAVERLDFGSFVYLGRVIPYCIGTWVVPAGVTRVEVTLVGGGGAGGADEILCGGGGGAGAYRVAVLNVTPGQVIPVTLGAGGYSMLDHPHVDPNLDSYTRGDGGRTSFGDLFARGGKVGATVLSGTALGGNGGDWSAGEEGVVRGAKGGPGRVDVSFGHFTAGDGAQSRFGAGGGRRSGNGSGWPARAFGAGGGGALFDAEGGAGGVGCVVLRY